MKTLWLLIAIFIAELAWSYCASRVTVELVHRKVWRAVIFDAVALSIAYEVLAVIGQANWDQRFIVAAICGGVCGTALVASRKTKKKTKTSGKTTQMSGMDTQNSP